LHSMRYLIDLHCILDEMGKEFACPSSRLFLMMKTARFW
jgi:hypothetical protein